jgi:ABC-2 type transport system ATP-binding protein
MSSGLIIRNLSKRFGDILAIDGIDIDVPRGALVGFLGSNGAGKTTAMRAILGIVRPDSGTITWDGAAIDEQVRSRIGYMPQERGLYARMPVIDQVVYFGRLAGLDKSVAIANAGAWIERLGLVERQKDLVQELSGGNQQRVQLAVSLVHDPDLLVLDEPFAGLDPVAAETMQGIIAERAAAGASVLFSSHQLDLVEGLVEQVVIVADGREVAAGAPIDLRSASPYREMSVRWVEPVEEWSPLEGRLLEFDGSSALVELPATVDVGAQIAHALSAGAVATVSVEPPSLADVFAHTVNPKNPVSKDGGLS